MFVFITDIFDPSPGTSFWLQFWSIAHGSLLDSVPNTDISDHVLLLDSSFGVLLMDYYLLQFLILILLIHHRVLLFRCSFGVQYRSRCTVDVHKLLTNLIPTEFYQVYLYHSTADTQRLYSVPVRVLEYRLPDGELPNQVFVLFLLLIRGIFNLFFVYFSFS